MVDTIERVLNPFSLTTFFFGFGILRYPLDHPRFRLSIFYILILWSIYACIFHYVVTLFSIKHIFANVLSFFVIIINLLVTMASIIIAVCEHEKYRICIRKLGVVDDTLEKLGTPKEYHRMRNSIKWMLIMWFVMICMIWGVDSLWCIEKLNDIRAIVIPLIIYYTVHINNFMDIMFMFLLRYISTRLDKINDHIRQLSETEIEESEVKYTREESLITRRYARSVKNRKHVLWIAMHLHSELCRIAHNMNSFFGIQMTLQMMSYFVILMAIFYFKYHNILCLKRMYGDTTILKFILSSDVWSFLCITKLISFNYICESVSIKAQKTKDIIYKLSDLTYFAQAREEICQFVLQISLRPLKFSGMGLFYFGYKFIRKFFVCILSTVIFMIQMDTSPIFEYNPQIIISDSNNVTCYN